MDPRRIVIARRFEGVRRVLAVTGGKGGIGKSLVSSLVGLLLARRGMRVGLLDLDFTGPSTHLFLGLDECFPTEEFGIEPPVVHGVRLMSVVYFLRDHPVPLRGADVTNALIELLAITRWGDLDALIVDMPPGLGDATLDSLRLLPRVEYLLVAIDSRVVLDTVRRTLRFHAALRSRVSGIVENMKRNAGEGVRELAESFGLPFLGALRYDDTVETATGDAQRLAATPVARALEPIAVRLLSGSDPGQAGPPT